jgi:hypothetical protein
MSNLGENSSRFDESVMVIDDLQPDPPFLGLYTEEDMALKTLLQGVHVFDLNTSPTTQRPVPVWFRSPEREERRITYPNIQIDFMGERVAHEREHRGLVPIGFKYLQNVPFVPFETQEEWKAAGQKWLGPMVEFPIPFDFDYEVTVSARINQHISQISATLAQGRLDHRFALVHCPGGTTRRVEVLGVTRTNSMEADKRLFRQIYRVRIPTEVEWPVLYSYGRVREVILSMVTMQKQPVWGPKVVAPKEHEGE